MCSNDKVRYSRSNLASLHNSHWLIHHFECITFFVCPMAQWPDLNELNVSPHWRKLNRFSFFGFPICTRTNHKTIWWNHLLRLNVQQQQQMSHSYSQARRWRTDDVGNENSWTSFARQRVLRDKPVWQLNPVYSARTIKEPRKWSSRTKEAQWKELMGPNSPTAMWATDKVTQEMTTSSSWHSFIYDCI